MSKNLKDFVSLVIKYMENRIRLKILILGPGSGGGNVYKKRCEIRELIKSLGHEADFCEDILKNQVLVASGLNLSVAEYILAKTYDYIVCLMASPGSIGEVHDLARHKKLACMMMICIDSQHEGGYSAKGILRIFEGLNGKIDWFISPADINQCHLATRVLDQIKKVAEAKQLELAIGGSSS